MSKLGFCLWHEKNNLGSKEQRLVPHWPVKLIWHCLEHLKCYTHVQPNFICRALRKHLLSFLVTLVKCLSQYTKGWRLDKERIFIGDLAYALALNLDLADNPQFYDLPVLETSLVCLVHVTAQPHWSSYSKFSQGMSLCLQLMSSLIQASVSNKAMFKSKANEHLLNNHR